MPKNDNDLWKAIGFASYISTYVAGSLVVSAGIGYFLDTQFSTLPLFTVCGLILGLVSAFYGVFKLVQRNDDK